MCPPRQARAAFGIVTGAPIAPPRRGGVPVGVTSSGASRVPELTGRFCSIYPQTRAGGCRYSRRLPAHQTTSCRLPGGTSSAREGARALHMPEGGHAGSPPFGLFQTQLAAADPDAPRSPHHEHGDRGGEERQEGAAHPKLPAKGRHPCLPLDRSTARTLATEDAFVKFRRRSMRFEQAAVIGAPRERVWSVVSDWERQASWMPDVSRIEVRGPERELGASMTVRTKVFGIPA